ncbi:hypothetical protein Rhopal_001705-T1 [Rhodotorula paludigena]|uniref:SRR1-like domain-containing protein n=1 Tax=Rhodotorula paludigena TaxID=86838 RepID=A0AAV5GFU4_9BASI|nr:hypothetical protein Rhopal_001705-T1 [Rhodotorula paludigena]
MSDHEHADDFTAVSYKKPGRAPRNRKGKNRFRERTLEEKLAAREEALVCSGYLRECRARVLCLGLGSVSDSSKAQDQYLLLRELLDELQLDGAAEFYDPVFTAEDAGFLESQGHKVLAADLCRMLLLGNRLDLYNDPTYSGSLQRHKSATDRDELGASAPFVTRAATKDHLEAFNDLALEWPTLDRIDAESACEHSV